MDSFVESVYHSGLLGEIGPGARRVFDVARREKLCLLSVNSAVADWTVMDSSTMVDAGGPPVPSLQVVANQGVDATGNVDAAAHSATHTADRSADRHGGCQHCRDRHCRQ